jgi:predicted RNA-binding protein YlqC (UPF0109 family)
MTDHEETALVSPGSPDRKRSLEDESSSDDDDTRGGRFKRQALNSSESATHPSPPKRSSGSRDRSSDRHRHDDAKRENGNGAVDGAADPNAPPVPKPLALRCIITTKEAGIVIGKSGRHVAEIREQSGARLNVSENVPGAHERVLTVIGPLDTVAKAFSLVALKFVQEQQSNVDAKQRHTAIKLLVPHARMGSIIGKAGSKIKEVQDASGAKINATEELLPNSTERIVTIQGVVDSVHIATYHIGAVLQDHPERAAGTVLYKPLPGFLSANITSRGGRDQAGGPHGGSPGGPYAPGMMMPPGMAPGGGYPGGYPGLPAVPFNPQLAGMPPGARPPMHGMAPGMALPVAPIGGAMQLQQIFIPNDMVGAIIGKGGTKINEIRNQSGCQIKIGDPADGSTERLVSVTGTPEGTQMALYLLYQRLESEKARMNNAPGTHR